MQMSQMCTLCLLSPYCPLLAFLWPARCDAAASSIESKTLHFIYLLSHFFLVPPKKKKKKKYVRYLLTHNTQKMKKRNDLWW